MDNAAERKVECKPDKKHQGKKGKKGGERDLEAGLLPQAATNPLSGDVPDELVNGEGYPDNPFA